MSILLIVLIYKYHIYRDISKNRSYVRRTELASGRVASAQCIPCALTVRRTFFLIPSTQKGSASSGCAGRPLVQPNPPGAPSGYTLPQIHRKRPEELLLWEGPLGD